MAGSRWRKVATHGKGSVKRRYSDGPSGGGGQCRFRRLRRTSFATPVSQRMCCASTGHRRRSDVLVAWTEVGSQRVSLAGQLETAVDIMGAAYPVSGSIELTENPVYLAGRGLRIAHR